MKILHLTFLNLWPKPIKETNYNKQWKGLFGVIDYLDNKNLRIKNKDKISRVHIDQCMFYFSEVTQNPNDIDNNFNN